MTAARVLPLLGYALVAFVTAAVIYTLVSAVWSGLIGAGGPVNWLAALLVGGTVATLLLALEIRHQGRPDDRG